MVTAQDACTGAGSRAGTTLCDAPWVTREGRQSLVLFVIAPLFGEPMSTKVPKFECSIWVLNGVLS